MAAEKNVDWVKNSSAVSVQTWLKFEEILRKMVEA